MDSDKYLEGQSMQRPPLFESDSFIYWKNRFETYVKSKDLDLWHVITNGDFQPIIQNPETKLDEVVPFEKQTDDLKRRLAKNNEAKMVIYNALPRKEYERIFMCNTAKEIWKTLLITHQGNSQVKDNKIDLLVQQYEQFVISEDESIDSAFARFNTIITSLKALDEGYSSKNYVRKFLRALHPKWRAKFMCMLQGMLSKIESSTTIHEATVYSSHLSRGGTWLKLSRWATMRKEEPMQLGGADRSFVSTTFSALIDIPPTNTILCILPESHIDIRYTAELADRRNVESETILGVGILQQIPAFYFICASLEAISAIEDTWERGEVWGDIQVVTGFVLGGKDGFRFEEPPPTAVSEWDITAHLLLAPYTQMYASIA
ncbi:hypothetical protein Tco_0218889 [Tanacetum coccineum]